MKVRFIPQWELNDSVITLGQIKGCEYEVGPVSEDIESCSYEADKYKHHDNAPTWVRYWPGPFEVEILREEKATK